jgi:hypothetical protein
MIPFISRLEKSQNVLIAGCGGGFDVFAGVPLGQYLQARGKSVAFANFSLTNLWMCGGERIAPTLWRVDRQSSELPYFPERWLVEWLNRHEQPAPVYAFAKSGVAQPNQRKRAVHQPADVAVLDLCGAWNCPSHELRKPARGH